jgi:hypothetical protein
MTKNIFISTLAVTTVAVAAITTSAVAATHPVIGTWKLNIAKSTDESSAPPPKSQTFVFAESADGVSLATTIVRADGKSIATKGQAVKWDGTAHPENTNPDHDSVMVKQVGARTIEWTFTKKGALVRSGTVTVSRDGTMMTLSGASVAANGTKTYFNDVFDRK